jgi:AraC-like DNA-binding protein
MCLIVKRLPQRVNEKSIHFIVKYDHMDADLHFLHSSFVACCGSRVDKYFEGYCSFQLMERGHVDLYYDDLHFALAAPCFWAAYPGPRIRFHTAPGKTWVHRYVAFKGPLADLWLSRGLLPRHPQTAQNRKDITSRFDELILLSQSAGHWDQLRAINLLEGLLLELAAARTQSAPREPWLEDLLERLNQEKYFCPDYEQLAADYGMALSTLRRRFRQTTGTALHTYVMQIRIAHARALLGDTDLPLKAIAQKLGYNDLCYFARQFHEVTGVSPGVYRKTRQNII